VSSALAEPALLSARDAAAFLGVSLTSFRDHVGGELLAVRIGRRVLYDRRDLQRWIEARKASPHTRAAPLAKTSVRAREILACLRAR
jgi:excisionase family DNA binding protein